MLEKIDMEKLQKLVYYINNVKMSASQRERMHGVIVGGILHGEINTDDLMVGSTAHVAESIDQFLESDFLFMDDEIQGKWIQANVLYEKYDHWCGAGGIRPESLSIFGRYLKDTGVQFKKKADGNYYLIDSDKTEPTRS